jgi:hypothetical protein
MSLSIKVIFGIMLTFALLGEELKLDFSNYSAGLQPTGFVSKVTGEGKPGIWKIIFDEAPTAFPAITPNAPTTSKKAVLAQLDTSKIDEHFPLLIYDSLEFSDFTITAKIKLISGQMEQMGGIAFRIQDEKNYYVIRASALGNTFKFYKFVNGQRSLPIGPDINISTGVWHEITIECKGNQIRCSLNGKEVIPWLTDYSFTKGKIGFWTKSDSITYFSDVKISYKQKESLATILVKEALEKYPRIINLKIYGRTQGSDAITVLAAKNKEDIGKAGGSTEKGTIENENIYVGKTRSTVIVTIPLHDRNGETIAALQAELKRFPGQTEKNAIARVLPIVRLMEDRLKTSLDLFQ